MKYEEMKLLDEELGKLVTMYGIEEGQKPSMEFFSRATDCVGFYDEISNEIWVFDGLNLTEAKKTVRHEFAHFLLWLRHPNKEQSKKEERIANMMERTPLKFLPVANGVQKTLDKFRGSERVGESP